MGHRRQEMTQGHQEMEQARQEEITQEDQEEIEMELADQEGMEQHREEVVVDSHQGTRVRIYRKI